MGKPISRSSGVSRCAPQTTIPAKPDTCASRVVKSPMQPSSIRPPLSITKTLPGLLCCIASRNTSTLPKCWTGRTSPAIRAPGTTGLMPGGAMWNAIFRRSAASATSGVESLLKAERDCSFTSSRRSREPDPLLYPLFGYQARYGSGTDRPDGRANRFSGYKNTVASRNYTPRCFAGRRISAKRIVVDALLDHEGSYWFSGISGFVYVGWHAITYSEVD